MVMERINGFSKLGKGLLDRFQGSAPAETKKDAPARQVAGTDHEQRNAPQDTAEISPKAHRLMALRQAVESASQVLAELPEVRQDRIAEVRARLDRGFYNSVEVRTQVAERLDHVARNLEVI
jgi:hypothetical protein